MYIYRNDQHIICINSTSKKTQARDPQHDLPRSSLAPMMSLRVQRFGYIINRACYSYAIHFEWAVPVPVS